MDSEAEATVLMLCIVSIERGRLAQASHVLEQLADLCLCLSVCGQAEGKKNTVSEQKWVTV